MGPPVGCRWDRRGGPKASGRGVRGLQVGEVSDEVLKR